MGAATSPNPQVRKPNPAVVARSAPPPQAPRRPPAVISLSEEAADEELILQLGDLPRMEENMDVEGLKPSLLSRLFDLVAPVRAAKR